MLDDKNYLLFICNQLNISYNPQIIEFWNNKSFTLFGSTSTKLSLYDEESVSFQKAKKIIGKRPGKIYNTSSYKKIQVEEKYDNIVYSTMINSAREMNKKIELIEKSLIHGIISNSKLLYPKYQLFFKIFKSLLKHYRFLIKRVIIKKSL